MASINDFSNNAKIICPFFKMQYKTSLQCLGFNKGQQSTNLVFKTAEDKTNYINSFCTSGCYKGCPIAIAIQEEINLSE